MFRRATIKPKGRRVGLDEQHQRQQQAGEPARITKPPGQARKPAHAFFRHQAWQHGVVEHRAQFKGDGCNANANQCVKRIGGVGPREPDQRGENRGDQRTKRQHRAPAPSLIGNGPKQGREQRNGKGRQRLHPAPLRLTRHGVMRDALREISGDDEGGNHRREAAIRPIIKGPSDGLALTIGLGQGLRH